MYVENVLQNNQANIKSTVNEPRLYFQKPSENITYLFMMLFTIIGKIIDT